MSIKILVRNHNPKSDWKNPASSTKQINNYLFFNLHEKWTIIYFQLQKVFMVIFARHYYSIEHYYIYYVFLVYFQYNYDTNFYFCGKASHIGFCLIWDKHLQLTLYTNLSYALFFRFLYTASFNLEISRGVPHLLFWPDSKETNVCNF